MSPAGGVGIGWEDGLEGLCHHRIVGCPCDLLACESPMHSTMIRRWNGFWGAVNAGLARRGVGVDVLKRRRQRIE